MSKLDTLHRFIFENMSVRGEHIHLDQSFQTIVLQHQYPSAIRKILGEALCVAGLLSAIIKFKGKLTVQFRGNGKLKLLLAQCDSHFNMRALAKWDGDLTYDDLMAAFNEGVLAIMLDSTSSKQRYQGIVSWRGNSLAESVEGYFNDSEQLATKIWLAVNDRSAAGYLLQVIPDTSTNKEWFQSASGHSEWDYVNQLSSKLTPDMLMQYDLPLLLRELYVEDSIRLFPPIEVSFKCTCSRKKGEEAILVIGEDEADAELKDKNSIVVTCDFCNKEYLFDRVDVAQIFQNKGGSSSTTLH